MNFKSRSAYVVVRCTSAGYQTSTVNKLKASCTAGARQAVERLAAKLYGAGPHTIQEQPARVADHNVTQWHIRAGAPQSWLTTY